MENYRSGNIHQQILKSQQAERICAMRDMGNLTLAPEFLKHKTNIDSWSALNDEQRSRKTHMFLRDTGNFNPSIVTSRDGHRTAFKNPSAGRKTNQCTRKRAARTRTSTKTGKRPFMEEITHL